MDSPIDEARALLTGENINEGLKKNLSDTSNTIDDEVPIDPENSALLNLESNQDHVSEKPAILPQQNYYELPCNKAGNVSIENVKTLLYDLAARLHFTVDLAPNKSKTSVGLIIASSCPPQNLPPPFREKFDAPLKHAVTSPVRELRPNPIRARQQVSETLNMATLAGLCLIHMGTALRKRKCNNFKT